LRRVILAAAVAIAAAVSWPAQERLTFAVLGDRTGDAQDAVYEQVLKEAVAERPAFILTTGDSIEGGHDQTAEAQWRAVQATWKGRREIPLYVAAGNHDIWSDASEKLFRQYTGRAPRYSFDSGGAHVTVLDNSRADELSADDLAFLESDLKAHAAAQVKFIAMHRPSWILSVALGNSDFPLHRIAKEHGVRWVIAGHVHQILRFDLDGITYLSMPSAGGHLRLSKQYEDGWFFGHARVTVTGREVELAMQEAKTPHGQGRVTHPADWGAAGLRTRKP
jgi:3',5'-cyclic-AMP phosphodiesterase